MRVWEGAEVGCAVVFAEADELEAWEIFGGLDADEIEIFIVFEGDVVAWAVVFDEFGFEDEGFGFVADSVGFEALDGVDESACFDIDAGFGGGIEVLCEAFAEVFGFADVDDRAEAVFHEIDAWFVGDGGK